MSLVATRRLLIRVKLLRIRYLRNHRQGASERVGSVAVRGSMGYVALVPVAVWVCGSERGNRTCIAMWTLWQ